jgi:hypothetical protein
LADYILIAFLCYFYYIIYRIFHLIINFNFFYEYRRIIFALNKFIYIFILIIYINLTDKDVSEVDINSLRLQTRDGQIIAIRGPGSDGGSGGGRRSSRGGGNFIDVEVVQ